VTPVESLSADHVRRTVTTYRDALRSHQEELNRLNVYPVPDGDTGTNMALTVESVCAELDGAQGMPEVCQAIMHGSLMGARGNSGVILSQILRGLAATFTEADEAGPDTLVTGLRRATDAAYRAVMRPVEGTILTVVREATEAAEAWAANGGGALPDLLERTIGAANASVEDTPELLPVLKEAGVVDAGGRGFALLLDSLLTVVDGRPLPEPEIVAIPAAVEAAQSGDDVSSLRYEVMYFLEAADETVPAFKDAWAAIGDSIVVVGGDGVYNCHVHTNDIGAAIEAGIEAGRPRSVRVTDLLEEVEEEEWVRTAARGGPSVDDAGTLPAPLQTGVVAVAVGEGLHRLLRSLGVQAVVAGGQSMNPSTAQILDAVHTASASGIVVLPDNRNIVPVARQAAESADVPVEVVPTASVVEGLCALVAYDPHAPLEANVEAMTEAASRVRTGEVTQAVRDAETPEGPVAAGDWIALDGSGIRARGADAVEAAAALVDHLVDDDSELVTVLVGHDAGHDEQTRLEKHLAVTHPNIEVEIHDGGQPLYPFLLGVE